MHTGTALARHLLQSYYLLQKRRIKPTLISSFGLLGLQEDKDHKRSTDRGRGERLCHPTQVPKDDLAGWRHTLNLPTAPVSGLLAVACTFDFADTPITMKLLSLAARVLRSGHCLLSTDRETGSGDRLNPVRAALEALLPWIRQVVPILYHLAPSQTHILDTNRLVQLLHLARSPDSRRASSLSSTISQENSSDDLDAVPLAYDTRRDSRTRQSDRQPHLHANQQRTRDQLHAWIRGMSRWRPSQAAGAGFELIAGVHDENLGWFAELLLNEYEQLERHQTQRSSRLERLEVRLTNGAHGNVHPGDNPVLTLIRMTDSLRLTTTLQSMLFVLIEDTLLGPLLGELQGGDEARGDGKERTEPAIGRTVDVSLLVSRLVNLGRLLATCAQRVTSQYDDPVLCFARELLVERATTDQLLMVVLSLVGSLLRTGPPSLAIGLQPTLWEIQQRRGGREEGTERREGTRITRVVLGLLLDALLDNSHSDDEETSPALFESRSKTLSGSFLDNLMVDPSSLEFVLGRIIEDFKPWQIELAACCTRMEIAASSDSPFPLPLSPSATSTISLASRPPRKVRPVAAIPEAPQIQRRLRQWFWWQWPAFRDTGLVLVRYLQGEGHTQTAAARILWTLLPPLLPEALKEAPNPMLQLVISLLLEEYAENSGESGTEERGKEGEGTMIVLERQDNPYRHQGSGVGEQGENE